MPNPTIPSLHGTDLRLLRIFAAVVRNGGFTAAQVELNISQGSISEAIATLEARLGMRLCKRGRGGFHLTNDGQQVYTASQRLFRSLETFRQEIGTIKDEFVGTLALGIVDAIVTMTDCPLWEAIGRFHDKAPGVNLSVKVAAPQDLVRGLIGGQYDAVVIPIKRAPAGVEAMTLDAANRQTLYCGLGHPLFDAPAESISLAWIEQAPYVGRIHQTRPVPKRIRFSEMASTADMEAIAALISSGRFIGYLPQHYAAPLVAMGRMKPLFEPQLSYTSRVCLAIRKSGPGRPASRPARLLFDLARAVRRSQEAA